MNYSRKQLYALGEPFGESATRLKPGGRVYGGGGSSSQPADTTQTTTQELPEWARGYAKDTLAKASALTDISKNPYQVYGADRIAGFQPMQQQAFQGAANMQPSAQLGLGTGIAGAAGIDALNTNYQGGNFQGGQFDSQAAQQYMSPYSQNVVDYQKSQALRDFQIAQPMRNAQAVSSGAFGGSRGAIMDAEAQRTLNSQLQGIEATGQQNAFQNAQQQYNADQARRLQAQGMGEQSRQYGAGLGMQGLQTGLQSASTLGQLGQTQYGQQMGINQLQNQYGTQQQQQAQRPLDMAYQDFMNQQNYPYKQLGFMSDMIRGLPLGQQSTAQVYQAPPSALQTVGALGLGAYGVNQMMKAKGGLAESYAGGGMVAFGDGGNTDVTDSPMDDPSVMAKEVSKLSDQQLQEIVQRPSSAAELQAAKMELATRASEKNGLASAYNMMSQQAPTTQATPQAPQMAQQAPQQPMMQAAKGGIMGFAGDEGSDVQDLIDRKIEDAKEVTDDDTANEEPNQVAGLPVDQVTGSNADLNRTASQRALDKAAALDTQGPKTMDTDQYLTALTKTHNALRSQAGTDTGYEQFAKELADARKENAGAFEQQKGLAALAAIPAVLQGGNAIRGLGAGTGAFANLYGQYASADKKQKLALSQMQFNLADAKRKENLGLTKDAVSAMESVRKNNLEADRYGLDKAKVQSQLFKAVGVINKPVRPNAPNFDIQSAATIAADLKASMPMKQGETPEQYDNRVNAAATLKYVRAKNAKENDITSNVTSNVTGAQTHDIALGGAEAQARNDANAIALAKERDTALKAAKNSSAYLIAQRKGDTAEMKRIEDEAVASFPAARAQLAPTPAPAPKAAPTPISQLQTPEDFAKQTNADPNISKEAKASMIARYKSGYPSALADEKAKAKPATAPAVQLPPGVPPGSTIGKFVQGKGTEVLKNGKVIGYVN